jgi:O-succinylhomoserine sulfhydrylase
VNYFSKWNIETTYFDIYPDIIESCIKPNTKILLPNHLLTDGWYYRFRAFLGCSQKLQFDSVMITVFATPCATTNRWGAHLVVRSATEVDGRPGWVLGGSSVGDPGWFRKFIYSADWRDLHCLRSVGFV